ncbi:MAG: ribonuclease J [Polyangia bacterium]
MSDRDRLRFIPLGGFGEIGMNCLALEFAGRLLLVDFGVMFPHCDTPGVDVIHPSLDYLVERRDDIAGLVLTHGHEDHVAGVPYLLRELDVPIYGAPYTLRLLEDRLREFDRAGGLESRTLASGDRCRIEPFEVRPFPMPHSIIDNAGLLVECPAGRVLHSGDFRLGLGGADRGCDALSRLAEMAEGGVDVMVVDSTGAEEREVIGDETRVTRTVDRLVSSAPGRVFVSIFSSNVGRLEAIIGIARKRGRKVALSGRSVHHHVEAARETGELTLPADTLIPAEDAAKLPRDELLVLLSGTQGEQRSALGRLAAERHRDLRVDDGDLVILSSRFIPGNEIAISEMIDRLIRLGARVVHRGNDPGVHVSGHGSREEIRAAIEAVSPRALLPAHGTYRHMSAAAEIARQVGVPSVAVVPNGRVASLDGDRLLIEQQTVPVSRVHVDGGSGLPESAIRERRLLANRGLLLVSWLAGSEGELVGDVSVVTRGVISEEAAPWLADQIARETRRAVEAMDVEERRDPSRCSARVRSALRKFSSKTLSREPYVLVTIIPEPAAPAGVLTG